MCTLWGRGLVSLLCRWISSFPSIICWKDCSFSYWKEQHPCKKSVDHDYNHSTKVICAYFWTLCSLLSNYMSVLMTISHCFGYCSFEVNLKGKCDLSSFVHFFKIALSILNSLIYAWILGLICQFLKESRWNFYRDWICRSIWVLLSGQYQIFQSMNMRCLSLYLVL